MFHHFYRFLQIRIFTTDVNGNSAAAARSVVVQSSPSEEAAQPRSFGSLSFPSDNSTFF